MAEPAWPALAEAASFASMRAEPERTVPDRLGVLKDPAAFFRWGTNGDGVRRCPPGLLARYRERVAELAEPDLVAWLHGGDRALRRRSCREPGVTVGTSEPGQLPPTQEASSCSDPHPGCAASRPAPPSP